MIMGLTRFAASKNKINQTLLSNNNNFILKQFQTILFACYTQLFACIRNLNSTFSIPVTNGFWFVWFAVLKNQINIFLANIQQYQLNTSVIISNPVVCM